MRVKIDSMPSDSERNLLESEFNAKFKELESAVPGKLRFVVGEMIREEIARHKHK